MTTWIVPFRPENFEDQDTIQVGDTIEWDPKKNKYRLDDIVYLYESITTKAVKYKCQVISVINMGGKNNRYIEMRLDYRFKPDELLRYENLKKIGLYKFQSARRVKDDLLELLENVEKNQASL